MKKLMLLASLALAPVALAQNVKQEGERATQKTGETAQRAGESARQGTKEAGERMGMATEREGTFKEAQAFNISGKLKESGKPFGEAITLERKGLPPAVLDVRDETKVYLDGKKVSARDLPEGAQVRAKFQLEGNESVAVRIDAKKAHTGGAQNK